MTITLMHNSFLEVSAHDNKTSWQSYDKSYYGEKKIKN